MAAQDPAQGIENTNPKIDITRDKSASDHFAVQRESADPLAQKNGSVSPVSPVDNRRLSDDNWDASKVPPSQFQKRKGSIYATPSSRDSHVGAHSVRDEKFHALVDAKYGDKKSPKARRGSKSQD